MATILTKRSNTASSVPVAGDLTNSTGGAELAVNTADKRLFTKDSGGTVVELGTNPSSITLASGTANAVPYLNGSKVLTSGSALTFDGSTFKVATATAGDLFVVESTDAGASAAPDFVLYRNSASPAASDQVGNILWRGKDSGGADQSYARILTQIADPTAGTETASFQIATQTGDGFANRYVIDENRNHIWSGSAELMRLTSTGLGIGTSSPASKLTVAGGYVTLTGTSNNHNIAQGTGWIWTSDGTASGTIRGGIFASTDGSTSLFGGSSVVTTQFKLDSSGNLGLGVTPSAWGSTWKALQLSGGSVAAASDRIWMYQNVYINSVGQETYINTAPATAYRQYNGLHYWYTAPSGTAGNAISFTQAMTLDASGRLGIGTSSPATLLHVQGNGAEARVQNTASAEAVISFRNSASSVTPLPSVGTATGNDMKFTAGGAERARIDSSGNLLVGTTADQTGAKIQAQLVSVSRTTALIPMISASSGGSNCGLLLTTNSTSTRTAVVFENDNGAATVGSITTSGSATAYNTSSDYRLKENIQPMQNALGVVAQLNPVTYTWKADGSDGQGFIAHELQAVVPDCVTGEKDAVDADGNPVYQGIDTSFLVATLTAAIQELKAEFDAYKASHP